jgi:hypothetical protein
MAEALAVDNDNIGFQSTNRRIFQKADDRRGDRNAIRALL